MARRTDNGGFYRPVIDLSWKLDYLLHEENARGYHITNVSLHTMNVLSGTWLIYRIMGSFPAAILAGSLFALSPVHGEAIAWVSGRTDLLAAFFYLLSLHLYLTKIRSGRHVFLISSFTMLTVILAMSSKEMSFTLPFAILLLDFSERRFHPQRIRSGKSYWKYFIALILMLAPDFILGSVVGGYGAAKHCRFDLILWENLLQYVEWLLAPVMIGFPHGSPAWHFALALAVALGAFAFSAGPGYRRRVVLSLSFRCSAFADHNIYTCRHWASLGSSVKR